MSRKRGRSDRYIMCFKCYGHDHEMDECTAQELTSCWTCFRLNVRTTECNCRDRIQAPAPQALRLVGKSHAPRWFVDITIHHRLFAALVNPTLERGCVSKKVAKWLIATAEEGTKSTETTITFQITRKELVLQITCDISKHQQDDIHIGADLMKYLGYTFVMENVSIDSQKSYVASSPYEHNYIYNLTGKGDDLRDYLREKAFFLRFQRTMKENYGIPVINQASTTRRIVILNRSPLLSSDATTDINTDSEN